MNALAHTFECKLPVPTAQVFQALVDPAQLRAWFAEHAEVEPRASGAYRFWGRHTYGAPTRDQATQTLRCFESGVAIAFDWTLHERHSEVRLELSADAENPAMTVLKGSHHFATPPAIDRAREMVDDLWRLNCGNLTAHLTGGTVLLPDYADPDPQIRVSISIAAPRTRVFTALMDPALLNQWVASAAEVEPRLGGRYSFGWKYEHGGRQVEGGPSRILELVENEKLVTDWPDWRGDDSVPRQRVTWLLEDEGEGTRLTLIHDGFVRAVDISDYPFGWGWFLSRLVTTAMGDAPAAAGPC